jgi:hypothetical protein
LTGPTRKQAKKKHELLVEGWKDAVEFAEITKKDGYWPVHITGEKFAACCGHLKLLIYHSLSDSDLSPFTV